MERFSNLLQSPHHAFTGASPHQLEFAGLVLVPDLIYPSGPTETISPELWSDALNAKVLGTVAMTQAFLPTICDSKARVLVLTPNIISSLRPAFHGVESAVIGALEGFTTSLRRELGTLDINVCHLKLGTFDSGSVAGRQAMATTVHTRLIEWSSSARALFARNFINQAQPSSAPGGKARGTSVRELHAAIFDALTVRRPRHVIRVGRGSLAYDVVGNWMPGGLVSWMMGNRKVDVEEMMQQPSLEDSVHWEKVERV